MKKIITLLFFVFLYTAGYTQVWKQLPDDGDRTNRSAAFAINGTGYFFLGGYQNTVLSYDTTTHVWTPIATYPEYNTDGTVGCSLNGYGYAGMGVQYSTFSNSFYRYNPTNNTWKTLPDFPGTTRAYGAMFALDGKIYMGGGLSSGSAPNNDFYAYDPADSTWTPIASCPARGVGCDPVAFVIGDKAYVGTGGEIESGLSVPQKDFSEYDTTSKVWTQIDSLPGSARAEASAFSTCDRGFVGLGYTNTPRSTDAQDFWQYNPSSGKWTQIADYGAGVANGASAVTIGNTGYVAGGLYVSSTVLYDLWSYAPSAIPAFSADTVICEGGSITYKDTSNYSPTNWYWQFPGGTPDTSTLDSVTITYNDTGYYNVTLTAWNNCDSGTMTFTKYVHVGAGGTLTILPRSPKVCSGQTVKLIVQDTGSFTWSPLTGLSAATGDSVVVSDTATIVYSVSGTSSGGCATIGTDSVIILPAPALLITPQDTTICNGSSVTLFAPSSGSGYSWNPSVTLSSIAGDSAIATPTVQTTYTVTGTDSLGCTATGTDMIYVNVGFNKPIIADTDNLLTSTATQGNQWYRDGAAINGATSQSYTITDTGCYYDIATNIANGCSSISNTLCLDTLAGINLLTINPNLLSIYPNPTGGEIFINISSSVADINNWNLQIIDVLGRTVYTRLLLNYTNDIDVSNLPGGVYFITVINKTGRAVFPIVRQN